MGSKMEKVAPWETYTDGDWHVVRTGPLSEGRQESERQHRRHYQSMREWCRLNRMKGQLSRRENGRILRVRIVPDADRAAQDRVVAELRSKSRSELGLGLMEAVRLLNYALHLRQYGENAPGGTETWREFDMRTEGFLRRLRGSKGGVQ